MTKTDLVNFIAEETGLTKADSARAVDAMLSGVIKGLKEEKKVSLTGFFTIENVHKDARQSKNPRTGETITVPARNAAKFKAGSKLKEALN